MSASAQRFQLQRVAVLLVGLTAGLLSNAAWVAAESPMAIGDGIARELLANGANATSTTRRDLQTYSQTGFQSLLLAAVNKERAAKGLSALCMSSKLQSSAQRHSNDMASNNYMSHTGSDGSSMSQRITATGFQWTAIAENVAAGQKDVAAVMTSWMNSSGHKANILSSKYKMFGCGYAYSAGSKYKHYWTQDFGTSSSESCSKTSTPASTTATPSSQSSTTPTPTVTTKAPTAATSAPSTAQSSMHQQMLTAVNKERAAAGLSALCTNSKLQSAAQSHSNDMASNNYMSHTGSDGSSMSERITASGYTWTASAENVAAGQTDVTAVMTAWMNSSGHKANILSSKTTMFGMGYAYSAGSMYKHYWTQDFGAGSGESCS